LEGEIKVKEFLKSDLALKILSVILALFLWFAINPVKTDHFNVPLNVINEESLKAKGLVLNTNSYQKYIDVSVRERADVLDSIKDADFEVTLDLSKVKSVDDKVIPLDGPVYLGSKNISSSNMEIKPKTVTLDLGKIEENPFNVQIETYGKLPSGYEIISKTAEPNIVSIQALDSVLANVGSVKVYVDVTGLKRTINITKECKIYNKKGEEMPELGKRLNVNLKIEIGKKVTVLPITEGSPAKDFIEGTTTAEPDSVLITGDYDTMSLVNELKTQPLKIDGATKSINAQVLLQLPDGIKLVSSSREVKIKVEIIPLIERTIELKPDSIFINGKKDDTAIKYEIVKPVSIRLKGKTEDVNRVTVDSMLASIDVSGLEEGTHNVPLEVTIPPNVTQVEDVLVPIKITKGTQQ
jgi:YbbR domain-containing protein